MATVNIGSITIGEGLPPFIVAEAGINHNGDLDQALKMISAAKQAGAGAVKFQTFKADELCSSAEQTYTYFSEGKEVTESMLDMFKRCEFSQAQWKRIRTRCGEENITFLSTPQNRSDLDLLLELGIDAIKVGSDDFTNYPQLKDYASTGLPLFLSCGMADMGEVYQALEAAGAFDGHPVVLLYCVSLYPTPPNEANLRKITTLRNAFPNIPIGFSDHTQGPLAASLAAGLGACVLEKHFTLSHDLAGPDHWFSEEPEGLRQWVESIRKAHLMLGEAMLKPSPADYKMRKIARRSIAIIKDAAKDETLSLNNVGMRRPGDGIPASLLGQVLGCKAVKALKKGDLLKFGDFK